MISEITRREIFDALRIKETKWTGRLDEDEFLARIYDLQHVPSTDSRFENAEGDIRQHRIHNPGDWDDDWVFKDERFGLLHGDDETFLRFLCEMIHPVVRGNRQETEILRQLFNEYLAADGYEIVERSNISGYPVFSARRKIEGLPLGVSLAKKQEVFNADSLGRQITRIDTAIADDPDLAIGTAKELVETCCKTILEERGIAYDDGWELTKVIKETCKVLKLTPDDIPDATKASDTIKRLLSNLATITQGLAELRNSYGTGHGKSAKSKGLGARHARLAAGAATTLAIFLFETHEASKTPKR
jgi:hypothetical protein